MLESVLSSFQFCGSGDGLFLEKNVRPAIGGGGCRTRRSGPGGGRSTPWRVALRWACGLPGAAYGRFPVQPGARHGFLSVLPGPVVCFGVRRQTHPRSGLRSDVSVSAQCSRYSLTVRARAAVFCVLSLLTSLCPVCEADSLPPARPWAAFGNSVPTAPLISS